MQVSSINSMADARRAFAVDAAAQGEDAAGAAARRASGQPSQQQIRAAARQFEAIILRQLLTPAIEPLMSGGLSGESKAKGGSGVYGYFATDVLANSLSQGNGLGLAKMLEKQLTPRSAVAAAQAASAYQAKEVKS